MKSHGFSRVTLDRASIVGYLPLAFDLVPAFSAGGTGFGSQVSMFRFALGSVLSSRLVAVMGSSVIIWGCAAGGPSEAEWPPVSKRWFDRGDAPAFARVISRTRRALPRTLCA